MSKYLCMAKLFFFVICQKEDRCSGQISLQSEERVANVWNMTVTVPEWLKSMKTIWQYRGLMKMKIENTSSNSRSGEMDSYLGFLFNDLMLSRVTLSLRYLSTVDECMSERTVQFNWISCHSSWMNFPIVILVLQSKKWTLHQF